MLRGVRGGFDHKVIVLLVVLLCCLPSCAPIFVEQGISLDVEGTFMLQLSAKSTGLFESFYSQLKPVVMLREHKEITGEGRITDKELNDKFEKKFPFSFSLKVIHLFASLRLPFDANF